jgi:hypothetical protein
MPELIDAILQYEEPAKALPAQIGVVPLEDGSDVVG